MRMKMVRTALIWRSVCCAWHTSSQTAGAPPCIALAGGGDGGVLRAGGGDGAGAGGFHSFGGVILAGGDGGFGGLLSVAASMRCACASSTSGANMICRFRFVEWGRASDTQRGVRKNDSSSVFGVVRGARACATYPAELTGERSGEAQYERADCARISVNS